MRTHLAALRAMLVFTLLLGLAYPLAIVAVGRLPFLAGRADGSLVSADGRPVGSALVGQSWTGPDGAPLRQYLQGRPSAGGYDPAATGASNLGPESRDLLARVCARSTAVGELEGVSGARPHCTPGFTGTPAVPADAVTASGSGLDPDISPAYAALQVRRLAAERGAPPAEVRAVIARHTTGRFLGVLGEPRVNVLAVNLELDERWGRIGG